MKRFKSLSSVHVSLNSAPAVSVVVEERGATVGVSAWVVSINAGGAAGIVADEGEWASVDILDSVDVDSWDGVSVSIWVRVLVVLVGVLIRVGVVVVGWGSTVGSRIISSRGAWSIGLHVEGLCAGQHEGDKNQRFDHFNYINFEYILSFIQTNYQLAIL